MTFDSISEQLPNGFHDAKLTRLTLDLVESSIVIQLNVLVGGPNDIDPEARRNGTLRVTSPCLFVVEAPEPHHRFIPDGAPANVDGDAVRTGQNKTVDALLPALPRDASLYRFFVDEWGSFIYLGGADVGWSWNE